MLKVGSWIGKLFAADERRRVRDPDYLSRMFGDPTVGEDLYYR